MASSAVSSVFFLRDAAGIHAETRTSAYFYYGDAAKFPRNGISVQNYALLEKLVINTSKQCQRSAMDCVATHSLRHKKLASIVDGILRGIDALIQQLHGMVFPL